MPSNPNVDSSKRKWNIWVTPGRNKDRLEKDKSYSELTATKNLENPLKILGLDKLLPQIHSTLWRYSKATHETY